VPAGAFVYLVGMRVAAIDIGTNTVLLLVAEATAKGLVAVEEHAAITRLGEGVDRTRKLLPAAIARTNEVIDRYGEIIRRLGAERVDVVGTSAMRDAEGGAEVRAHVEARLGVPARTVSGEEEARLTFGGALSGIAAVDPRASVRVFDIGGGSTEIVHGTGGEVVYAHSFDVGSVRLTERHVKTDPPAPAEIAAIRAAARETFAPVPTFASAVPPIGIAGTMTTLAAVALKMATWDATRVHGLRLSVADLERVLAALAALPLTERSAVPGLEPKRADVIIAGGHVALAYLAHAGADEVLISDRGVRWGLAEQLAR